jgi:hypothetical protein
MLDDDNDILSDGSGEFVEQEEVSLNWLLDQFLQICPGGAVGEDEDGQIIFYTSKRLSGNQDAFGDDLVVDCEEE